jgi:hypothetical protein
MIERARKGVLKELAEFTETLQKPATVADIREETCSWENPDGVLTALQSLAALMVAVSIQEMPEGSL